MKQKWIRPQTTIEKFVPDEYIAACWRVGCSTGPANQYEITNGFYDGGNVSHDGAHCGRSANQRLFDTNGDNIPDIMYETGTDGLGRLLCTIYADGSYSTPGDISSVTPGDDIYWTTTSGSRTWHHQGRVSARIEGKPNAS